MSLFHSNKNSSPSISIKDQIRINRGDKKEITGDMSPEQIAEIVSERIIGIIRKRLEGDTNAGPK